MYVYNIYVANIAGSSTWNIHNYRDCLTDFEKIATWVLSNHWAHASRSPARINPSKICTTGNSRVQHDVPTSRSLGKITMSCTLGFSYGYIYQLSPILPAFQSPVQHSHRDREQIPGTSKGRGWIGPLSSQHPSWKTRCITAGILTVWGFFHGGLKLLCLRSTYSNMMQFWGFYGNCTPFFYTWIESRNVKKV